MGARTKAAVELTSENRFTALMALIKTSGTTNAAVPILLSTLLIVFQVSPTLRCSIREKIAGDNKVPPEALKTMVDAMARNSAIVDQIMGNATGGGWNQGRALPLKIGSLPLAFGRALLSGLKTRERTARNSDKQKTKMFAGLLPSANDEVVSANEGNVIAGSVTAGNDRLVIAGIDRHPLPKAAGRVNKPPGKQTAAGRATLTPGKLAAKVTSDQSQNGRKDSDGSTKTLTLGNCLMILIWIKCSAVSNSVNCVAVAPM